MKFSEFARLNRPAPVRVPLSDLITTVYALNLIPVMCNLGICEGIEISKNGHDKLICRIYVDRQYKKYVLIHFRNWELSNGPDPVAGEDGCCSIMYYPVFVGKVTEPTIIESLVDALNINETYILLPEPVVSIRSWIYAPLGQPTKGLYMFESEGKQFIQDHPILLEKI